MKVNQELFLIFHLIICIELSMLHGNPHLLLPSFPSRDELKIIVLRNSLSYIVNTRHLLKNRIVNTVYDMIYLNKYKK